MITRLWRQRRRIFILSISAALAAMILFGPGLWSPLALLAGAATAITILLIAPTARQTIESLALVLPAAAALPLHDVASPVALGAGTLIAHILLHGRWSDKTPLRLRLISRRKANVAASVAQVWQALIPGEGDATAHWNGTLIDYAFDQDDPLTLYMRHASPTGIPAEATVTFLSKVRNRSAHFIYETNIEDLPPGVTDEAVFQIRLSAEGRSTTLIESELIHHALPLRLALGRWLDDAMGDEWDSFAATVACKRDWSMTALRTAQATQMVMN